MTTTQTEQTTMTPQQNDEWNNFHNWTADSIGQARMICEVLAATETYRTGQVVHFPKTLTADQMNNAILKANRLLAASR